MAGVYTTEKKKNGALEQLIVLMFRGGADRALKGLESVLIKLNNPSLYLDQLSPSLVTVQTAVRAATKTTESRGALITTAAGLRHKKPEKTASLYYRSLEQLLFSLLLASCRRLGWGGWGERNLPDGR